MLHRFKSLKPRTRWMIAVVVVILLLLIIAAVMILLSRRSATTASTYAVSTINAANPVAALETLNSAASQGLLSLTAKSDFTSLFSNPDLALTIPGSTEKVDAVQMIMQSISDSPNSGSISISLDGKAGRVAGNKVSMEASMSMSGDIAGVGNLSAQYDMLIIDGQLYFKINTITSTSPILQAGLSAYVASIADKWYTASVEDFSALGLPGLSSNSNPETAQTANEKLIATAEKADNKEVNGQTLTCLKADYEQSAVKSLLGGVGDAYAGYTIAPVIFCSDAGKTPLYMELNLSQGNNTNKTTYLITPYAGIVNPAAPVGAASIADLQKSLTGGQ